VARRGPRAAGTQVRTVSLSFRDLFLWNPESADRGAADCNAEHNPPYLVRLNGAVTALKSKSGTPPGLLPWKYESTSIRLEPGDSLLLYKDAEPEAFNASDAEFSEARLESVLSAAVSPCSDLIGRVHASLLAFTAGAPQSDDVTMVAGRRT
jgi:sigma-B regulation protein RsbU (phosphoserine phosphatase)